MSQVLLIEPDKLLAETYAQTLIDAGHSVFPCASAQAAIITADQSKPDVVILEIQLIEHSGIEFLYEFRSYAEWQDVPVIILSQVPPGEFSGSLSLIRNQLGVRTYLYKPLTSLRALLASVDQLTLTPA